MAASPPTIKTLASSLRKESFQQKSDFSMDQYNFQIINLSSFLVSHFCDCIIQSQFVCQKLLIETKLSFRAALATLITAKKSITLGVLTVASVALK